MALSLAEGAILAEIAATPGAFFDEGIGGALEVAAAYQPDGLWEAAVPAIAEWLAMAAGHDSWIVVTAGDDIWIKQ
jgi:hypothetical protein